MSIEFSFFLLHPLVITVCVINSKYMNVSFCPFSIFFFDPENCPLFDSMDEYCENLGHRHFVHFSELTPLE